MSEALKKAYASNTETPLSTFEFKHSSLSGGAYRIVQAYSDLTATLENSITVTFTATGLGVIRPEKGVNGRQDLTIQIDNVSNIIWQQLKLVIDANRVSQEKVECIYRSFLESDLSEPGEIYRLTLTGTTINRKSAVFTATFSPVPDIAYPRLRYYASIYPGVKYAR